MSYLTCETCGKLVRPRKARKEDHPGTVAYGRSEPPTCKSCLSRQTYRKPRTIYRCEQRECYVYDTEKFGVVHAVPVKKRTAQRPGKRYCAKHYPAPRCLVCKRRMHPRDADPDKWVGLIRKGSAGRCVSCSNRNITEAVTSVPDITTKERLSVLTLVVSYFQRTEEDDWQSPAEETLRMLGLTGISEQSAGGSGSCSTA